VFGTFFQRNTVHTFFSASGYISGVAKPDALIQLFNAVTMKLIE